jgi:hypothetical protein
MRHGTHGRNAPDPLAPIPGPAWLVVRDSLGNALEAHELAPRADLRKALAAVRAARVANGWTVDEIRPRCAFFFAVRDGVRVLVAIELRELRPEARGI